MPSKTKLGYSNMNLIKKSINRILKTQQVCIVPTSEKVVYLTFDDGPMEDITSFVENQLDKYQYKATFFCRGDNAEANPEMVEQLRRKGHTIGNHTYSHIHSYDYETDVYVKDVEKADSILHTNFFRPPHGSITLGTWLKLRTKYNFFYWTINSGDSDMERYDYKKSMETLKSQTCPGAIVLFHFCHRHQRETEQILPVYLEWLHENGWQAKAL